LSAVTAPFQPKGEAAQYRLIEDFMLAMPMGYVASVDELALAADCPPRSVPSIVLRVNDTTAVAGFMLVYRDGGYRVGSPEDCLARSVDRSALFLRQAKRGKRAATTAILHPEASSETRRRATDAAGRWGQAIVSARDVRSDLRKLRPEYPVVKRSGQI
jgi:hypothetical protein